MTCRARVSEHFAAALDRAGAEFLVELRVERLRVGQAARFPKIGRPRREEEIDDVLEPIFDRAEASTIAPALSDVERGLAVVAPGRIDRAQVGHVIEPALLGARADVEVDALDRQVLAD